MEGATLVFALSLATSTGPSRLHGNPFLMSAYLHIRTAQSQGEGEREWERLRRRSQGEGGEIKQCHLHRVPQWCNSHYHLTLWQKRARHSLQQIWPIFFYYILFCRREDKTPPPSFLVNFQSHFVTVLLFPLCWPAYLDKGDQPSILLRFRSYRQ